MDRAGNFIIRLIKGVVIGVAAILPGASGGVLAVSMGVYRPVLDAVTTLFKSFKRNVIFLLPLGIGGAAGLFATSNAVEWLMLNWKRPVMWALIGMVAGGVPSLIKEANEQGFKKRYLWGIPVGAALIGAVALAQALLTGGEALPLNGFTAALCGALIGLGTVIPGISTSFLMMYMGLYEPFLAAFNRFDMPILLCAVLGGLVVIAALVVFVKRLFDRHHGYAYYGALGLLAVSVALIFPGFGSGWQILLYAALFAACFVITYFLCALPAGGAKAQPPADNAGENGENGEASENGKNEN